MANNVIITGPPGIGKTTLIKKLLHDLPMLIIRGFYTESIVENEIHRGYIVHTPDYREQILAHVFIEGPHRIGAFGVNVEGFEKLVLPELNLKNHTDLFVLDELGYITCRSQKFQKQVRLLFDSSVPVIASMSAHSSPEMSELKNRSDANVLQISRKNRDSIWKSVLLNIS